jgi:DNA-directed RNA polymerase specialized sigma24 family protein
MRNRELPATTIGLLKRVAARHSRVAHEAEDLVQDILLAAVQSGRDCNDAHFLPWAYGAIRNRAAFAARSAARRRRREHMHAADPTENSSPPLRFSDAFIAALPRSRRLVALLVNLGMGRHEIGYLLGLTDVALRQRIQGLKREFAAFGKGDEAMEGEPTAGSRPDGRARRSLKAALPKSGGRRFAIRDPDGLPIFFAFSGHIPVDRGNKEGKPQQESPK